MAHALRRNPHCGSRVKASVAPHMTLRCSCFPQICKIMKERAGDWRSSSFATWIGEGLKGTSLI
jgi:SH3-like domain-containing protein